MFFGNKGETKPALSVGWITFWFIMIFLSFGGSPLSVYGYHAWRKAQTYSNYKCFGNPELLEKLVCFFAPTPGFNTDHYVGLEAPFYAFIQYLLHPNEPPDNINSSLTVFFVLAPILALLYLLIVKHANKVYLLCIALAVTYLRSPTVAFFKTSFQPNMAATCLICLGIFFALSQRTLAAAVVFAIGVLSYPQLGLAVVLVMLPYYWERNYKGALQFMTVSGLIVVMYSLGAFLMYQSGHAIFYRHNNDFIKNIHDNFFSAENRVAYTDTLGLVGISFHAAFICIVLYLKSYLSSRVFYNALLATFVAYNVTFVLFANLFWENTYYGHILLSYQLFLLVLLAFKSNGYEVQKKSSLTNYTFAISIIGLLCMFLPHKTIPLRKYGSYVYTQLRGGHVFKCGPIPDKYISNNLILDCVAGDPFCRVAAKHHGKNVDLPYLINNKASDMATESIYARCPGYGKPNNQYDSSINLYMNKIDDENGWIFYQTNLSK